MHASYSPYYFILLLYTIAYADEQEPLYRTRYPPLNHRFDALVDELLDRWNVPGLAVSVLDADEVFAKGYGIATYPHEKVTPETLFYMGSTTKSFTAAAVSLLIDDTANSTNPLSWTTTLSSLIREDFVLPDEYSTTHVTLEDALSHRTGMPGHDASYGGANYTVKDVVRSLRYLPLTEEIRTKFQYCNVMFTTVSHAIENLTGMWLGDFLRSRIWGPIGMSSTYFSLHDVLAAVDTGRESLARGYYWNNDTKQYVPEHWMDASVVSGAGHVISNVLDYTEWLRTMIHQALPFSEAGHEAFRTARSFSNPFGRQPFTGPSSYTLGWDLDYYRGETVLWHQGALSGFGATMIYLPHRKWGVTMAGNTKETSNAIQQVLALALIDDLLETPESERFDVQAMFENYTRNARQDLLRGKNGVYPDIPKKALPMTLPMEDYVGTYNHPGYRNITLTTVEPDKKLPLSSPVDIILHGECPDLVFPIMLDLEHVSGEYFVAWVSVPKTDGSRDVQMGVKAEFKIGADGKVTEVGVAAVAMMGEVKIWFTRL
ncbi:MAG: hypothetical protein M1827_005742 [Pycnora praestabilis]|nr:MAG: hypothetical protein M1827_005742 [Pycnora praestabilis]